MKYLPDIILVLKFSNKNAVVVITFRILSEDSILIGMIKVASDILVLIWILWIDHKFWIL